MMTTSQSPHLASDVIITAAHQAARAIPPLWPLASSVAVNPFLGQTRESLATAAARLRRVAGTAVTMPRPWYADRLASGEMTEEDMQAAFDAAAPGCRPASFAALIEAVQAASPAPQAIPTVADLARDVAAIDWPFIVRERISHWAAGYFDQGQALWSNGQPGSAYAAWRMTAIHDLTPEIVGLAGFAQSVAQAPTDAEPAIIDAATRLGLSGAGLESYFHRLLMTLGGWSQLARYRLWQAELSGETDHTVTGLLAIRLRWEVALLDKYASQLKPQWQAAVAAYAAPLAPTADDMIDTLLQEAAERGAQRRLKASLEHFQVDRVRSTTRKMRQPNIESVFGHAENALAGPAPIAAVPARAKLQMAFCIDVRSEVFRRALERLDPAIQTLGFAGFFGVGVSHRRFASDVVENRLPVLLTPGVFTCTGAPTPMVQQAEVTARITARAQRAWGRFKQAAISSFAFVEAAGPIYVAKLLRDGLTLPQPAAANDPAPRPAGSLDLDTRLTMAAKILKAMSLTSGFARLVVLAGHGATVANNPHASALHCGACGGYSGEVNARLLAALLNDPDVRAGLIERGITIPEDTLFLAARHDTTTDDITLYSADHPADTHGEDIARAKHWLISAGSLARGERALRLPRAAGGQDIPRRARDWAELRPEWALAGCQAFVAAPRSRTAGRNLAGRAFLHDYHWQQDAGFEVLELILTAPVVVASWISLQYYGSTVAPGVFGAGNKLLHNVTGGIGVVEGNGGLLRGGLPWQSVHDGERLTHQPLRLSVLIEAPRDAISAVLQRHPQLRALFDNRWLHLFALDDEGRMAWRYSGDLQWQSEIPDVAEQAEAWPVPA